MEKFNVPNYVNKVKPKLPNGNFVRLDRSILLHREEKKKKMASTIEEMRR